SSAAKLLIVLVPRVGVEPTRPYGQRILRTLQRVSRSVTKRYEPVFARLAVVQVSLRLATYQYVRPPILAPSFCSLQGATSSSSCLFAERLVNKGHCYRPFSY